MSEEAEELETHETMTFWEHLAELRSRLIKMLVSFTIGAAIAWFFRERILMWLVTPFVKAWNTSTMGDTAALHFPAPASLFLAYIKIAILAGLVLSLPMIFYQIWSFIAPGLHTHEKKLAIPFVVSSTGLFAGGGLFGWKFAFPVAFGYLLNFAGPVGIEGFEVKPTVMIGDYIEFISRMLIAFGVAFELPVLIFFLSYAGLVTHHHLIRFTRYFAVIAVVLAAIMSPPDITSQILLAVPLMVLYILSIGVAFVVTKTRERKAAAD